MHQIISRREFVTVTKYVRGFYWIDDPGSGFSFPCDADGNLDMATMSPEALDNLLLALTDERVAYSGVEEQDWSYTEPAVLRCDCGEHVSLDGFTCTCERCGADYNSSGQRLAPRSQWGEETGESLGDILRIP